MPEIKLIALDLDGTLLNSEKKISPRNYAALERAASRGISIVPSTGRFYKGIPENVRSLPFPRYAITVNGAEVYDILARKALWREEIPNRLILEIFRRLNTLPVIYDCFIDGWGYMDAAMYSRIDDYISDVNVNAMVKSLRKPVEDLEGYVRENRLAAQKMQMFFADQDARRRAWAALAEEFPELSVTSSISNNVELNAGQANKGTALRRLCNYLHIDIAQTMAFGDSSNDESMITAAGIGVAMENGDAKLKEEADFVTATNDCSGVAEAIERFCFAEK